MEKVKTKTLARCVYWAMAGVLGLALNLVMAQPALAQQSGVCPGLPSTLPVYALTSDNTIYVLVPNSRSFLRVGQVRGIEGNLLGIDFRVADATDAAVYGTTDTGKIYLISLNPVNGALNATLVSTLTARFAGGFQSLMDFNPVVNALRLIGSNDQNFAVVNANGGNLNQTVAQTALQYVAGDVNAGTDPNITAGAYDNNVAGATQTTFYMIDYDADTLVTIADRTATGSSNTGGGRLKTIGSLVDTRGNAINFAPTAGLDIYTGLDGRDTGVAISGQTAYCIELATVDANAPVGTKQNVVATPVLTLTSFKPDAPPSGGFIDVALPPIAPTLADLAVSVDSLGPATYGGFATFTVTVTNRGPSSATGVAVSGGSQGPVATPTSVTSSQGACASLPRVSCSLGLLASGASAQVTVSFQIAQPRFQPPPPAVLTATFNVASLVNDPDTGNNTASGNADVVPRLSPPQSQLER